MNRHELTEEQTIRIKDDIVYLNGPDTAGRMSSSPGAKKAAEYLQSQLKQAGYQTSIVPVDVTALRLTSKPMLRVGDRQFKFRSDFAELISATSGGIAEGNLFVLRDGDDVDDAELKDKIVLIPERPGGFDARATAEAAFDAGVQALLIEHGEPKWFHKSPNGSADTKMPVLRIKKSVADELIELAGEGVVVDLPLQRESLPCQNVLGYLSNGNGSLDTLVLTAHYDHLGDDPDGARFPGAIDNGSGVAVVMELARWLSTRIQTLPFNVLVAFLTGEEVGMVGATHLASNPTVPLTAIINVDSLGFEPKLIKMRTGHAEPGHWLADIADEVIRDHGIETAWIAGGEDSMAFQRKGFSAIGLGQKPTAPDFVQIHSPMDSVNNLHFGPIESGYSVVREVVERLMIQGLKQR